jgi:hypothetical protein
MEPDIHRYRAFIGGEIGEIDLSRQERVPL